MDGGRLPIMTVQTQPWKRPVRVLIDGRATVTVRDTAKAAELLLQNWPEAFKEVVSVHEAQVACFDALDGKGSPEKARAAFIAACEEAGILIR